MLSIVWGSYGLILLDFVYANFISRLSETIKENRLGKLRKIFLLHDNIPSYMYAITKVIIAKRIRENVLQNSSHIQFQNLCRVLQI